MIVFVGLLLLAGCDSPATPLATTPASTAAVEGPTLSAPVVAGGQVFAEAKVVPVRRAALSFSMGGLVAEVLVAEGANVAAGQPLVRLQAEAAEATVLQAEARLNVAKAQLALLQAGPQPEEIQVAEAQVRAAQATLAEMAARRDIHAVGATASEIASAEAQLAAARLDEKAAKDAYELIRDAEMHGWVEEQALMQIRAAEDARAAAQAHLDYVSGRAGPQDRANNAAVWLASAQVDIAQAQVALLQAEATAAQIAVAQASVDEAEAALAQARVTLNAVEIHAPFAGTIAAIEPEPGEYVSPGTPIVWLADVSAWRIETTDLTELNIGNVFVGAPVNVTFDAIPGLTLPGAVTHIRAIGETYLGDIVYTVVIELDEQDARLRWNMTAAVVIQQELGNP